MANFCNISWDNRSISFIEPFHKIFKRIKRGLERSGELLQQALQEFSSIEQEVALILATIFLNLISKLEIKELKIINAPSSSLELEVLEPEVSVA